MSVAPASKANERPVFRLRLQPAPAVGADVQAVRAADRFGGLLHKELDDIGESSGSKNARLQKRVAELQAEKRRLEISEIEELKKAPIAAVVENGDLAELLRAWHATREGARCNFMRRVGLQLALTPPDAAAPKDDLSIPSFLQRSTP